MFLVPVRLPPVEFITHEGHLLAASPLLDAPIFVAIIIKSYDFIARSLSLFVFSPRHRFYLLFLPGEENIQFVNVNVAPLCLIFSACS